MISLGIRRVRKVKVGLNWLSGLGSEGDAKVVSGMNVMKGIEGRFHMPGGRFLVVGRKERMDGCKVRTSVVCQPTNTTN